MSIQLTPINSNGLNYAKLDEELEQSQVPQDIAIEVLDPSTPETQTEEKPSLGRRVIKWFSESGDPKRPPRWKRFALLSTTCTAAVASRLLTTDTLIVNAASLLSAVQVNAEIYDWSDRNKLFFLLFITGITTAGELAMFPDSTLLKAAKLSGLCWALAIRTFSVESQKWININAAQNK